MTGAGEIARLSMSAMKNSVGMAMPLNVLMKENEIYAAIEARPAQGQLGTGDH